MGKRFRPGVDVVLGLVVVAVVVVAVVAAAVTLQIGFTRVKVVTAIMVIASIVDISL